MRHMVQWLNPAPYPAFGCRYHLGVDNEGLPGAKLLQGLSHEHADVWGVHPYQPIHRPCRVEEGSQHVEGGSHLQQKAYKIAVTRVTIELRQSSVTQDIKHRIVQVVYMVKAVGHWAIQLCLGGHPCNSL